MLKEHRGIRGAPSPKKRRGGGSRKKVFCERRIFRVETRFLRHRGEDHAKGKGNKTTNSYWGGKGTMSKAVTYRPDLREAEREKRL